MKLRNILLALTALYFFTRKKEKTSVDPKKDSVPLVEKKEKPEPIKMDKKRVQDLEIFEDQERFDKPIAPK